VSVCHCTVNGLNGQGNSQLLANPGQSWSNSQTRGAELEIAQKLSC